DSHAGVRLQSGGGPVQYWCRCKGRKCSLACGYRNRCTLRRTAPVPVRTGGRSMSRPRWVLLKLGRSRVVRPDPNHPSRLDCSHPRVLPMPWHSFSPRRSSINHT
ncbi:unnamed protein product, partial [Ectocarpus sp. 4 AP-2014]